MPDEYTTSNDTRPIDRRTMLRLTSGALAGSAALSGVVSAGNHGSGNGGKSGGRGQTSSPIHLDEPFTVSNPRHIRTNASCMSDSSALQDYNRYDFEYCDTSLGGGTICVIPEQSEVDLEGVYEFRSRQECRAESSEFQEKISFGPSNAEC